MESSAATDEALLARYATGDVVAFEALYARYEMPLWRYVLRLCAHHATAEEVAQDTWFTITREAPRFTPTARFAPWLFTIARNRAIDRHRTTHAHSSVDAATEGGMPLIETLADEHSPTPDGRLAQQQQHHAILQALGQLPLDQRDAFLLHAEAGLSLAEIATLSGVSAETVKSRLRYARDKLRHSLRDYA